MYRTLRMLVVAAVMSAAIVVGVAGPARAATVPTPDHGNYTILTDYLDVFAKTLGSNIGAAKNRSLSWVMENANRRFADVSCQTRSGGAFYHLAAGSAQEFGFCWYDDPNSNTDDPDGNWYPQGVTSTADAYASDYYDGTQAVAVTWYHKTQGHARLSLAPIYGFDSGYGNYRHLLFAQPTNGGSDFSTVSCHAGGAMWYGDLLYVACTDRIKLYSLKHIYSADTSAFCQDKVGRRVDGTTTKYCASGYAYVILQVGQITSSNVHFSSISLDREATPDKLVVSQYSTSPGARLWRFNLDAASRLPASSRNYDAWELPFDKVQGAITRDTKFWFHSSGGVAGPGESISPYYGKLRFWDGVASSPVKSWTGAYGADALSYFGDNSAMPDTIFTVSEHPRYRGVIAVRASDFD